MSNENTSGKDQRAKRKSSLESNKQGGIYIGTSNIVLPGNKTTFPTEFQNGSRLHYYASLFNTVEINSSFYKTPQVATCAKWSADVPPGFQFSLKLSKEVTHIKDLTDTKECLDQWMVSASGIGEKQGCILVQFLGKISLEYFKQVERILEQLSVNDPEQHWRIAVEFRHSSWYIPETWELLDEYDAVIVLHDIAKGRIDEFHGSSSFVYIRFHGPEGDYRGSYTVKELKCKADLFNQWRLEQKDVYAYFNNTIGNAFENALTLKRMIE